MYRGKGRGTARRRCRERRGGVWGGEGKEWGGERKELRLGESTQAEL